MSWVYNFTMAFTNWLKCHISLESCSKHGKMNFQNHASRAKHSAKQHCNYLCPPGSNWPYLLQQNKGGTSWTCDPAQCRLPSAAQTQDISWTRLNLSVPWGPLPEHPFLRSSVGPHVHLAHHCFQENPHSWGSETPDFPNRCKGETENSRCTL